MIRFYALCLWVALSVQLAGTFFFVEINATHSSINSTDLMLTSSQPNTKSTDFIWTPPWFNLKSVYYTSTSSLRDANSTNLTSTSSLPDANSTDLTSTSSLPDANSTDLASTSSPIENKSTHLTTTSPWFHINSNQFTTLYPWNDKNSTSLDKNFTDVLYGSNFTGTHPRMDMNSTDDFDTNFTSSNPNITDSDEALLYHSDPEMDWLVHLHLINCGSETLCGVFDNFSVTTTEECGPCSCDQSCLKNKGQGCCPDVYPSLDPPVPKASLTQCEPVIFPLTDFTPYSEMQPRLLISRCPYNITDSMSEIVEKCQKTYWQLWESGLQEYAIPVTDRSNLNHHYKNVFCALCHGKEKSELIFWKIQILSDSFIMSQLMTTSMSLVLEEIHSLINSSFNFLFLQFQPPAIVPEESVSCYINRCNVTGIWRYYVDKVERACHLYSHGFNNTFANSFCSMCNKLFEYDVFIVTFPYTVLLDVNGQEDLKKQSEDLSTSSNTCQSGYIYDPIYRTCREFRCNAPFLPVGSECVSPHIQDIQGLTMSTEFYFKLTTPQSLTSDIWYDINISLSERVQEIIQEINTIHGYELELLFIDYGHIVNVSYTLNEEWQPVIHDVEILQFIATLFVKPRKTKMIGSNTLKDLIDSINQLTQCKHYHELLENQILCMSTYTYISANDRPDDNEMRIKIDQILPMYENNVRQIESKNDHHFSFNTTKAYQFMVTTTHELFNQTSFIHLSDLWIVVNHTCQQVIFIRTEYVLQQYGVLFPIANKTIPYENLIIAFEDILMMCMEVYNALIVEDHDQMRQDSSPTSPSTLVSAVCSGLSVLFLTITIIYYSCIHVPQMMPGWMLMLLCISLLLTQLLSILISSLHISSRLCQVLALTLHFCQLTYLFWMNVSTYHLYKACTNDPHRSTLSSSVPLWYIVYVYSGATVFVLINIAVQLVTSQGKDIGYGGAWCFISTTYMAGITLLLPLSAVLCASIVMTSLVILRTPLQPDINMVQKSSTKWIQTFLKLSALSSLTWLFDCVHHWTNLDVFIYVYTALNASQGLFIVWAFVLRKYPEYI